MACFILLDPGISLDRVKRGAENSALVLGAYKDTSEQVGYLRVISDKSRFAYLCDVWIDVDSRGKGLASRMIRYALEYPDFSTVYWLLATADAHNVYTKLGFAPLQNPERWLTKGILCSEA